MANANSFEDALGLYRIGRVADAEGICAEIIEDNPRHFGALALAGGIAVANRRYAAAVDFLSRAVAVNPKAAKSYNTLGEALRQLKRNEEALASFDTALALDPQLKDALAHKAQILFEKGRFEEEIACLDRLIALSPNFGPAWFNRATALTMLRRPREAFTDLERALVLEPKLDLGWDNWGALLFEDDKPAEALASFDRAIALNPGVASFHYNRGNALRELNRIDEAIASYDAAIACDPDYSKAIANRSICLLTNGEWKDAWPAYEHRDRTFSRAFATRPWLGEESITGKRLLIHPELFLGDLIQFCRYAKCAADKGAHVFLAAPRTLHALLGTLGWGIELVDADTTPARFDLHTPLMSLPLAFGTGLDNVPADVPYLHADAARVAKWRKRMGARGFNIGVCWRGRQTDNAGRLHRSFPVEHLRRLAEIPGVSLVSLQKFDERDLETTPPGDFPILSFGEELDSGPDAFLDTAAMMASLDLVIAADTAVAHLAGALARPTWIVLPEVADWRWLRDRNDSPWYPTARLFRQKMRGEWTALFTDVKAALDDHLAAKTARGRA
jgi:tetratricopeptide (TPR) repeat protein